MDSLSTAPLESSPSPIVTSDAHVRFVFTMVHGTWARSWPNRLLAKMSGSMQWYEEGSTFRAKLATEFPSSIFCRSDWSGKNSIAARMEASKTLAFELKQRLIDYPYAQHFIIAHSHGGNIVCYTFRDNPELEPQITGVITLSTPFLYGTLRTIDMSADKNGDEIDAGRTLFDYSLLFVLLGGLYIPISTLVIIDRLVPLSSTSSAIHEIFSVAIMSMMEVAFVWSFGSGALDIARHKLDLKTISLQRLLVIRVAADEASAALLLSQLGIWLGNVTMRVFMLPVVLWHDLSRVGKDVVVGLSCASLTISSPMRTWLSYVLLLGGIMGLISWLSMARPEKHRKNGMLEVTRNAIHCWFGYSITCGVVLTLWIPFYLELQPFPPSGVFLPILFIVSYGLMTVAAVLTPFLACLSVGFKYMFAYMFYALAVEAAPPGVHTIHQFGIRADLKEEFKTWFNHSIAYESGEVITAISAWVRKISLSS